MSFFTRLRDPTLVRLRGEVSYQRVFKAYNPDQPRGKTVEGTNAGSFAPASGATGGGGSGEDIVGLQADLARMRQRGAGVEEKGNHAPSAEQPKKDTSPEGINKELEGVMAKVMAAGPHNLEHKMPWTKEKPAGTGINTSGIIKVDDEKYFAKMQTRNEADCELGAWQAAQALGWHDMARPSAIHIREGEYINSSRQGVVINPLLPEGESLMTFRDGYIAARVDSSDVNISSDKLERMMAFEYAIGAVDRHGGNYWYHHDTGDVSGIDYARSYMPNSDASENMQNASGQSSEEGGIWDRSFNPDRIIAREHLQKIVDNEEKLVATIPKSGGFRTPYGRAVESMRERVQRIREVLESNSDDRISMRGEAIWA